MKLCDCTWPPQIMRWQQSSNAHVCPNQQCGRRRERARPVQVRTRYNPYSRRRDDWMDN
jgi:hypothetical protein